MPQDLLTTVGLIVMTGLSLAAWAVMWSRLAGNAPSPVRRRTQYTLTGACTLLGMLLVAWRMVGFYGDWQPLHAHVDGLLLMAVLIAATALFLQTGRRLPEFSGFALPLLSLILLWGVCASWWSFQPFKIQSVWSVFHRAAVYLGAICVAVGAIAGGMFLYVQKKLHNKKHLPAPGRFGSLETMERMIVSTSALGFALLSVSMFTGMEVARADPSKYGHDWWYSPKVILAVSVWLVYGLLMNVRHTALFRGRRAAWLSIVGLLLLLATMGVSLKSMGASL